jgi:hypothetical protein
VAAGAGWRGEARVLGIRNGVEMRVLEEDFFGWPISAN